MNKKTPNKVVTDIEGEEDEEVNPVQFQDDILSCLRELQHLAETIKIKASTMDHEIRRFKVAIHGEDIDSP